MTDLGYLDEETPAGAAQVHNQVSFETVRTVDSGREVFIPAPHRAPVRPSSAVAQDRQDESPPRPQSAKEQHAPNRAFDKDAHLRARIDTMQLREAQKPKERPKQLYFDETSCDGSAEPVVLVTDPLTNEPVELARVTVEHCVNCMQHQDVTRHKPGQYERVAKELVGAIQSKAQDVLGTELNVMVAAATPVGFVSSRIRKSRLGSMDVVLERFDAQTKRLVQSEVIHSKVKSNRWPNAEACANKIVMRPQVRHNIQCLRLGWQPSLQRAALTSLLDVGDRAGLASLHRLLVAEDGVVPLLLLLPNDDDRTQTSAFEVLENMYEDNNHRALIQEEMVRLGSDYLEQVMVRCLVQQAREWVITVLVGILKGKDPASSFFDPTPAMIRAAHILGVHLRDSREDLARIVAAGGLRAMLALLKSKSEEALHEAALTIHSLSTHSEGRAEIVAAKVMPFIFRLLYDRDPTVVQMMANTLHNLMTDTAVENAEARMVAEFTDIVAAGSGHKLDMATGSVVRGIGVSEFTRLVEKSHIPGLVPCIVRLVVCMLTSMNVNVQREVAGAIAHFVDDEDLAQVLAESEAVKYLFDQMKKGDKMIQKHATYAISCLLRIERTLDEVDPAADLRVIVDLLFSKNRALHFQADSILDTLRGRFDDEIIDEIAARSMNDFPGLVACLRESGRDKGKVPDYVHDRAARVFVKMLSISAVSNEGSADTMNQCMRYLHRMVMSVEHRDRVIGAGLMTPLVIMMFRKDLDQKEVYATIETLFNNAPSDSEYHKAALRELVVTILVDNLETIGQMIGSAGGADGEWQDPLTHLMVNTSTTEVMLWVIAANVRLVIDAETRDKGARGLILLGSWFLSQIVTGPTKDDEGSDAVSEIIPMLMTKDVPSSHKDTRMCEWVMGIVLKCLERTSGVEHGEDDDDLTAPRWLMNSLESVAASFKACLEMDEDDAVVNRQSLKNMAALLEAGITSMLPLIRLQYFRDEKIWTDWVTDAYGNEVWIAHPIIHVLTLLVNSKRKRLQEACEVGLMYLAQNPECRKLITQYGGTATWATLLSRQFAGDVQKQEVSNLVADRLVLCEQRLESLQPPRQVVRSRDWLKRRTKKIEECIAEETAKVLKTLLDPPDGENGVAHASSCLAEGPGIHQALVGIPSTFTLYARDHSERQVPGGGNRFKLTKQESSNEQPDEEHRASEHALAPRMKDNPPPGVLDEKCGLYTCHYTVQGTEATEARLNITLDDRNICGMPCAARVLDDEAEYEEIMCVDGDPISTLEHEDSKFYEGDTLVAAATEPGMGDVDLVFVIPAMHMQSFGVPAILQAVAHGITTAREHPLCYNLQVAVVAVDDHENSRDGARMVVEPTMVGADPKDAQAILSAVASVQPVATTHKHTAFCDGLALAGTFPWRERASRTCIVLTSKNPYGKMFGEEGVGNHCKCHKAWYIEAERLRRDAVTTHIITQSVDEVHENAERVWRQVARTTRGKFIALDQDHFSNHDLQSLMQMLVEEAIDMQLSMEFITNEIINQQDSLCMGPTYEDRRAALLDVLEAGPTPVFIRRIERDGDTLKFKFKPVDPVDVDDIMPKLQRIAQVLQISDTTRALETVYRTSCAYPLAYNIMKYGLSS